MASQDRAPRSSRSRTLTTLMDVDVSPSPWFAGSVAELQEGLSWVSSATREEQVRKSEGRASKVETIVWHRCGARRDLRWSHPDPAGTPSVHRAARQNFDRA